jgi:hypothetical protein
MIHVGACAYAPTCHGGSGQCADQHKHKAVGGMHLGGWLQSAPFRQVAILHTQVNVAWTES